LETSIAGEEAVAVAVEPVGEGLSVPVPAALPEDALQLVGEAVVLKQEKKDTVPVGAMPAVPLTVAMSVAVAPETIVAAVLVADGPLVTVKHSLASSDVPLLSDEPV
jgi:hypothetical protein